MGLFDVRPKERRATGLAFLSLLGITAAHTMIETARDALFLAKIPVRQLPILYLAIAACGLVMTRVAASFAARRKDGAARLDPVAVSALGAAAITAAFWFGAATPSPPLLYALYIYTGLFASWVVGQLWVRIGSIFEVDAAKRVFGLIGTGAVLGAVAGAAVARAALASIEVRHLLLVGAGLLVATALGPIVLLPKTGEVERRRRRDAPPPASANLGVQLREAVRDPYVVRLLGLALFATSVATAIDFLFKSEIAAHVPPERMGATLATISLATNTASLVAQSVGVALLLRLVGVHRALYVMPLLLLASATAMAAGGANATFVFGAALGLRGVDGTLRYSLHKTSTELLFVPLPDSVRARAKPIVDLVGQRGGQAVASIAILGIASLGGARAVAVAVVALTACWLLLAWGIRPRYLEVFRSTLRRGRIELSAGLPELDMSALEALIAALSSKKDAEVLGALDLLAAQARGRLLPSLILFHPSKPVVMRALDLLVREKRTDFVPVADRLLAHADPEVRAAALRARAAADPDPAFLRELLDDREDELRASALVALVATGALSGDEAEAKLRELVTGRAEVRCALARAIGEVSGAPPADARTMLERTLVTLGRDDDNRTRSEAATAMGRLGSDRFLTELLGMLVERGVRGAAVDALGEMGEVAVDFLDETLDDPRVVDDVRWRVVSAMSRSTSPRAVAKLARRLVTTNDTGLGARILRALRTAQTAGVPFEIDKKKLVELAEQTIAAHARALAFRLAHARLRESTPESKTPAGELLLQLLRDKEVESSDRLFLTLGLIYPQERFARIQRGLASTSAKARASSRELLENVVRPPLRDAVLAIVDDTSDAVRLHAIGKERSETNFRALLTAMIEQGGELGTLAAYHAHELGLRDSVRDAVEKLGAPVGAFGEELSTKRLADPPSEPAREVSA
jgi:AAA family ATP:ADP antiporter